jgi:hypothetical protein
MTDSVTNGPKPVIQLPISKLKPPPIDMLEYLARDLLQLHEDTGFSLDHWSTAKDFVEYFYGPNSVRPNGV